MKMSSRGILWGLAVLAWILAIGYLGTQGERLWRYWQRSMHVPAEVTAWHVEKIGQGKYTIQATYHFQLEGQPYQHSSLVDTEVFRNESAANQALQPLQNIASWQAWYQAGRPENSSLEHSFPLKEMLSFSLLFAIGIYFLGIGYFVARKL